MTEKEYLMQYCTSKNELEAMLDEIRNQREIAEKITVSFESDGGTSGGVRTDKIESCVEKIIDLENEFIRRSAELADIRAQVYSTIVKVKDAKLRTLLIMRYIGGKSFKTISDALRNSNGEPYTENHIANRMHGNALDEVKKILEKS